MRQCIEKQHQNGHSGKMCHPNDTRVCIDWAYRKNTADKYTKWINRLNICCRMHSMSHVIFHVCRVSVYQIKNSGVAHFILRCWLSAFAVCSQFRCCFFLQFSFGQVFCILFCKLCCIRTWLLVLGQRERFCVAVNVFRWWWLFVILFQHHNLWPVANIELQFLNMQLLKHKRETHCFDCILKTDSYR